MKPIYVLPYSSSSASAALLVKKLKDVCGTGAKRRVRDAITSPCHAIRWGNTNAVQVAPGSIVYNPKGATEACVNKVSTLFALQYADAPCPVFSTSSTDAGAWLLAGDTVVARHVLTSRSGKGIQIVNKDGTVYREASAPEAWSSARLFTKYFKRKTEYRVFVVDGAVVIVYRKGRDQEDTGRNFFVRTSATGWNYCATALSDVPSAVTEASIKAAAALGMHVCAADVGYNEHNDAACVFEVNAAPGMEDRTAETIAVSVFEMCRKYDETGLPRRREAVPVPNSMPSGANINTAIISWAAAGRYFRGATAPSATAAAAANRAAIDRAERILRSRYNPV